MYKKNNPHVTEFHDDGLKDEILLANFLNWQRIFIVLNKYCILFQVCVPVIAHTSLENGHSVFVSLEYIRKKNCPGIATIIR